MSKSISVWLIEDEEVYRDVLADGLRAFGSIEVKPFPTCEAAFEEHKAGLPAPDVILLDIALPGISGLQALPKFRTRMPQTSILMLTVNDNDRVISRALTEGADGYLTKTSPLEEVVRAIRAITAGHKHLDHPSLTTLLKSLFDQQPEIRPDVLSPREKEILQLLSEGKARADVAQNLDIAEGTVVAHLKAIYRKLQVQKSTEAVAKAIREKLL